MASGRRSYKGISPTNGSGLVPFAYLLCVERLPVGIGDMKTETRQEPCQQVDACQNLGFLEAVLIGQMKISQPSDLERCSTCGKGTRASAPPGVLQLAQTFERIRFGRAVGIELKVMLKRHKLLILRTGRIAQTCKFAQVGYRPGTRTLATSLQNLRFFSSLLDQYSNFCAALICERTLNIIFVIHPQCAGPQPVGNRVTKALLKFCHSVAAGTWPKNEIA
jgi:hypothetical protein